MNDKSAPLVPIEEKPIDYHGETLIAVTVLVEGDEDTKKPAVYIPIRPITEHLGLAWGPQYRRIRHDPIFSNEAKNIIVSITSSGEARADGPQEMICLPLQFFMGWLFGVNVISVEEEVRETIISYQRRCYRALAEESG